MSLTKVSYSLIQGALANILDFGADPTGATSSTAALDAAIATGNSVYVPKGTFKLTGMSTLPSGCCVYGEGPLKSRFICDIAAHTGVFLRMAGGNNIVEKVAIEGNSTADGTAVRITNTNEFEFTGWMTLRDVHITGIKVGLDMNNVFTVLVDNCRIYGNYRGVRIVPSYDGIGDNGYFTTITFNKTYINQNTDYGLVAVPTIASKNLVLRDTVIESNEGIASSHQSRIVKVDPFVIDNCYFELEPTIPALEISECNTVATGVYMNGTGGVNLGAVSNTFYLIDAAIGASTDGIFANGTSLQQVQIVNSTLGTSTLNAQRLLLQNSTVSGTYYRNTAQNYDLALGSISNVTRIAETQAFTKTVSATINAGVTSALISDQSVANIWVADFTTAIASISNAYNPGLILTVTPATTGSVDFFCVLATNTTGSPITLTSAKLKVLFFAGQGTAI